VIPVFFLNNRLLRCHSHGVKQGILPKLLALVLPASAFFSMAADFIVHSECIPMLSNASKVWVIMPNMGKAEYVVCAHSEE